MNSNSRFCVALPGVRSSDRSSVFLYPPFRQPRKIPSLAFLEALSTRSSAFCYFLLDISTPYTVGDLHVMERNTLFKGCNPLSKSNLLSRWSTHFGDTSKELCRWWYPLYIVPTSVVKYFQLCQFLVLRQLSQRLVLIFRL